VTPPVAPARGLAYRVLRAARRRILSTPLFGKILGIGVLVALVFGTVVLYQTRHTMEAFLYRYLVQHAAAKTRGLAVDLARPAAMRDYLTIEERIRRTARRLGDIEYAIVRDERGQVVAHTFEHGVPADLRHDPPEESGLESTEILETDDGEIFAFRHPILGGRAGSLEIGVSDRVVQRETQAMVRAVLLALGFCATVGIGLAFGLARVVTRPILALERAARRIAAGDFRVRAEGSPHDETGRLALVFNEMAASLERYRKEVREREQARTALLDKLVDAQEEERRAIAQELHDHIGHSLLALLLAIQSSAKKAPRTAGNGADLAALEARVREAIDEVRRLAAGMRPSLLDDYGLDLALSRLVEDVRQVDGLQADYHYNGPEPTVRLPNRVEITLYRVAQEALSNAVRHAAARRVNVLALQSADEITLLIEDDGRGFDPSEAGGHGQRGLGLLGMKERVTMIGGTCVVESSPEEGTTVRAKIPLHGA